MPRSPNQRARLTCAVRARTAKKRPPLPTRGPSHRCAPCGTGWRGAEHDCPWCGNPATDSHPHPRAALQVLLRTVVPAHSDIAEPSPKGSTR